MSRRSRQVAALVLSTLLSFVVVEVAYRAYLHHRERADLDRVEEQRTISTVNTCDLGDIIRLSHEADLFYELKPSLHGRFCGGAVTTNALGMRMAIEPQPAKASGVIRVAGLGDSYIFAQRVDDGQGFLEVLQARALADGKPVEFLNFGVPGYNTWMEGVLLSKRVRHFAPDVIVVSITGNDWDLPAFMLSRRYGDVAHSFLLGALLDRLRPPPRLVRTPKSKVFEDHYLAVPEEVPAGFKHMVGFDGYRSGLLKMLETADELGAKVVLFSDCVSATGPGSRSCTFPFKPGQYEQLRKEVYGHPRAILCQWQLTPDQLIPGDGHPTVQGHRNLADQLRVCLEEHGLLRL
jgi:lysophospholipase L1-like esterase